MKPRPAERDRVGGEVEPNQLNLRRQVSRQVTKAATTPAADLEDARDAAEVEAIIQQIQQLGVELRLEALPLMTFGRGKSIVVCSGTAPVHGVKAIVKLLSPRFPLQNFDKKLTYVTEGTTKPVLRRAQWSYHFLSPRRKLLPEPP
jgi:predicted Abi (CAAX) family protease